MKASNLQAKILAVNTLSRYAEKIAQYEAQQLAPIVGTSPLKIDGTFKAKINHQKMPIEPQKLEAFGFEWKVNASYYLTKKHGYFVASVSVSIWGGGVDKCGVSIHSVTERESVDLFKVSESGIFSPLDREREQRKEYKEAEILAAAASLRELADKYREEFRAFPYEFLPVLGLERLTRA